MKPLISVAIPTYNRFGFLMQNIVPFVYDPRVAEIVISDDCSTDGSYVRLQYHLEQYSKVRLFRNTRRLDCYANKAVSVRRTLSEWVILMDDDNTLGVNYLDVLYGLDSWDSSTAYLPVFARPHFDYRAFSGLTVTAKNVASYMDRPHFLTALNTANYFVPRSFYLRVWDEHVDPHTADSLFMNYRWLRAGGSLVFVPGLEYDHLVHEDSHYRREHHKTGRFEYDLIRALRGLTTAD
jgi:glycosyltransferase involved in cell wall biosynthesis